MKMNHYSTKDLSVASFLYASGKKLIHLNKDNGRTWFLFDNRNSCEQLVRSFWAKEALVNAKEYSDSIRTLKELIFNEQGI